MPAFLGQQLILQMDGPGGVQLFVKTTREVSLTGDGAIFATRIELVLRALEAACEKLTNAHEADEDRLRINAPMSFGQHVLPQILCDFHDLYPKIDLQVSLTDQFLDMVEEDFDLAIRISGPPSDKFTIWRKICAVKRVLVKSPPLARHARRSPIPTICPPLVTARGAVTSAGHH